MKYYLNRLSIIAMCMGLAGSPADAQIQRDRFIVVKADELAEAPQRYWSRGIVFEDVLVDAAGRSKNIEGRRYVQVETRSLGRAHVRQSALDSVRVEEGRRYLFAGTVRSETGRTFFMRPRTQYSITIDTIERLADDVKADLLKVFIGSDPDRPAYQNVQRALTQAQQQLLAHAQNESVEVESLFEPRAPTMDKGAEVSRVAVRSLEQELGTSSFEILSQLVRELLVSQHAVLTDTAAPPKPAERTAPAAPPVEAPAAVESDQDSIDEQEEEEPGARRGLFRRRAPVDEDQAEPEAREPEPQISEEQIEEEPTARQGFFRRRAVESEPVEEEPAATVVEEVVETEDSESRPSRRLFRRSSVEEESVEPVIEEAPPVEEAVEAPPPTPRRRERPAPEPAPVEMPPVEVNETQAPVRRN